MAGHPGSKVRANPDPRGYVTGLPDRIRAAVDEVVALAARQPDILLGTGAIPYETPREKILLPKEYCSTAT